MAASQEDSHSILLVVFCSSVVSVGLLAVVVLVDFFLVLLILGLLHLVLHNIIISVLHQMILVDVASGSSPALCTNGPRFDSQSRRRICIWFPVHTCFRRLSPGPPGFPPASKTGLLGKICFQAFHGGVP